MDLYVGQQRLKAADAPRCRAALLHVLSARRSIGGQTWIIELKFHQFAPPETQNPTARHDISLRCVRIPHPGIQAPVEVRSINSEKFLLEIALCCTHARSYLLLDLIKL